MNDSHVEAVYEAIYQSVFDGDSAHIIAKIAVRASDAWFDQQPCVLPKFVCTTDGCGYTHQLVLGQRQHCRKCGNTSSMELTND